MKDLDLDIKELQNMFRIQLGTRDIPPETKLIEDLGADSFDLVNILGRIEERWGIFFDELEFSRISTVKDLFELLQQKQSRP